MNFFVIALISLALLIFVIKKSSVPAVKDSTFDEKVIQAKGVVVVDFWAPWCVPCKVMGPIIEELSDEYGNKVGFYKCNVDDNPTRSQFYNIEAIPTIVLFNHGKAVEWIEGTVGKFELEEKIKKIIG